MKLIKYCTTMNVLKSYSYIYSVPSSSLRALAVEVSDPAAM